jgi:hypothetical protein
MKLRNRVGLQLADLEWANAMVEEHHYLHRAVHYRAHPFAYAVILDGQTCGVIVVATPHFTRQRGLFGYPDLPTKWQVLVVSRLWLDPAVQGRQANGHASNVASCALGKMLRRVQRDWLDHHPPRYPDQPYHVRLMLAYADRGVGHEGTIYKAANFERWGETDNTRRRHTTRGEHSGSVKVLYVYRLGRPRWDYEPLQMPLPVAAVSVVGKPVEVAFEVDTAEEAV